MKIAFVVPGGVDRGGRERVVPVLLWLIERLARKHEVHVIVLDYYPKPCTYQLLGATIHDVGRVTGPSGFRRLRLAARLNEEMRRYGPFDIVHAYWGMPAGVVAVPAAKQLGVPSLVTLSSGELVGIGDISYGLQRRVVDRIAIRRLIRRASAVAVPTSYMAKLLSSLEAESGGGAGRIREIIPSGIDTSHFGAIGRSDGPPWRLIRVGSINAVKDYPTMLRALAALPAQVTLDVVGEDTLGGAVQKLARELGVDGRVTFHGWQPTECVAALYARAHLNVVASRHEACNISVLEAACAGTPTVGTAVGFVADWDPDRAVAVPVQDSRALAAAIAALLRDPAKRVRIAAAARRWAVTHDADWTTRAYESLYLRLIRG